MSKPYILSKCVPFRLDTTKSIELQLIKNGIQLDILKYYTFIEIPKCYCFNYTNVIWMNDKKFAKPWSCDVNNIICCKCKTQFAVKYIK